MSNTTLKLLALMALAATLGLGFSAEATAGPCKRDQVRDGKGKCVSVPTTLERAPEPAPPAVAVVPPAPPLTSAALPVQPERVTFGYGVSTPTLIRVPALTTFVVVACDMVTAINGTVGYTFMSQTTAVQSFGKTDN